MTGSRRGGIRTRPRSDINTTHAGRVVETGARQGYHTGRLVYEAGRTRVFDADGEWVYDCNDEGFVTAETDPLGHCTRSEWERGRLITRVGPLGRRTDYRYDDRGQLISVTDNSGRTIGFESDDAQLLTAASLPNDGRIKLEYDHLRRLICAHRAGDGENPGAFVVREWEVASRDARMLTEKARRPVTVGGRTGIQIDSTHERDGRLWHQMQTMFPSDDAGRVLVMTLTSAAPLTDEQQAIAGRMLASFQPRAARPTLLGPGDAS